MIFVLKNIAKSNKVEPDNRPYHNVVCPNHSYDESHDTKWYYEETDKIICDECGFNISEHWKKIDNHEYGYCPICANVCSLQSSLTCRFHSDTELIPCAENDDEFIKAFNEKWKDKHKEYMNLKKIYTIYQFHIQDWDSGALDIYSNFIEKKCIVEKSLFGSNPLFNEEEWVNRLIESKIEENNILAPVPSNIINSKKTGCPYCGSSNITKIGTLSKVISVEVMGLASDKIGKQWHCNNCKSNF